MEKYKAHDNIFRFLLLEYSSDLFEYLFGKKKDHLLTYFKSPSIDASRLHSKIEKLFIDFECRKQLFKNKIFREFKFLSESERQELWGMICGFNASSLNMSIKGKSYFEIQEFFSQYYNSVLIKNIYLPTREIEYLYYENKGLLKKFIDDKYFYYNTSSGILLLSKNTNKIEKWGRLIREKYPKHENSHSYKNDASKYHKKLENLIDKLEKEIIHKGTLKISEKNGFQEIHAYGKCSECIDNKESTNYVRVIISRKQRTWRDSKTKHKNGYETFFHGHPISESEVRRNLNDARKVEQMGKLENLVLLDQKIYG